MSDGTPIEWTDATWNPVSGCTKVSQGCKNCYAERLWPKVAGAEAKRTGEPPRAFTEVRYHPERLDRPIRWARPRRIFVNSMSDLFHEDVPDIFIADVFAHMAYARHHTFQVLTKRPERMQQLLRSEAFAEIYDSSAALAQGTAEEVLGRRGQFDPNARWRGDIRTFDDRFPLANVWLGISAEDQETFDARWEAIKDLAYGTEAGWNLWVSLEPLLGPVDLSESFITITREKYDKQPLLKWVVAGGESGPGARPAHPVWFRRVRDQCTAAGVPFLFKQWGAWDFVYAGEPRQAKAQLVDDGAGPGGCIKMWRVGKKKAGRMLDGREHTDFPTMREAACRKAP